MSEFKPTDIGTRQRIESDLDQTFAVSAGAGTGKTTLLVNRYIALVREKKISPSEIVAITFTIKAAAELRERIVNQMEKLSMREAIQQFESAPIGTIHSFCATVLKRFAIESGLDPHFKQMDTIERLDFLKTTFRTWFGSAVEETLAFQKFKLTGFGFSHVQQMAFQLYQYRDLVDTIQIESQPIIKERIDTLAQKIKTILKFGTEFCTDMTDPGYEAMLRLNQDLANIQNVSIDEAMKIILREEPIKKKGRQDSWRDKTCGKQFQDQVKELAIQLQSLQQDYASELLKKLIEWLKGFLQFVEDEKQIKSVLDFDDLLLLTRNLVRDNVQVRQALQNQFKYFLIDEFQDTDPIQAEIFWTLARNESGASNKFSYDDDLIKGKIFTVGDVCQSIYRFRNASVETYRESTVSLQRRGELVHIVQNFRSNPRILSALNPFFANLLQEDFQSLSSLPEESWNDKALHVLKPLDGENLKTQIRRHEAISIASHIDHLVKSETQIYDYKKKTTRAITYADVAILFPASTGLDLYETCLRDMSVPFSLYRSDSFFQTLEIRSVLHVLAAVLFPFDKLKVVEALSSLWMGFSFNDLALTKKTFGTFDYRVIDAKKLPSHLAIHIESLQHLHQSLNTSTPTELIDHIYFHLQTHQNANVCFNKDQVIQNLNKLVWLAQDFENQHGYSIFEFDKWITDLSNHSDEVTEARVPTQPNTVQIMTIHQSKGLEFPVVFVANLASETNRNRNTWVANRFYNTLEFRLGNKESLIKTKNFDESSASENENLLQEKKRLMYVALTRAKNILVLPSPSEDDNKTFMEFIAPIFDHDAEFEVFSYASDTKPKKQSLQIKEPTVSRILDIGFLNKIPKGYARTTATEEKGGSLTTSKNKYAFIQRPKLGIAFHAYVERYSKPKIQEALIQQIVTEHGIENQKDELQKLVTTYLNSDLHDRMQKSKQVLKEIPFSYFQDGILYEGYIDLIFEEQEGWTIVDLKTDQITEPQLEERTMFYSKQLSIYETAMKQVDIKIKDKILYFARLDKIVSL